MIARLFDRGVVLRMGTREIRASTARGLRDDLTGLTAISAVRIRELSAFADDELAAHCTALTALASHLSDALSRLNGDPAAILAEVTGAKVPLDGIWMSVIMQVSEWPSARSDYQRTLLDALLEYLANERDCVRALLDNRAPRPFDGARPRGTDSDGLAHQRLIFDLAQDDESNPQPVEFNRLTKGEPLEIAIAPGQCLQIMLAHHRFAVICGTPWRLLDEYGEDFRLRSDRCVVGRSPDCDLIVHDSFRAISRRHLVLETQGVQLLRITDISSLGTFVPRAYLDNRLH